MYYKNAVNNIPCIYKLTDKRNGKIYIGQTKYLSKRIIKYRSIFKNHYTNSGPAWLREMMATGENITMDDIMIEVVEIVKDPEQRNEREKYWISHYHSDDPKIGYNTEPGGGVSKRTKASTTSAPNAEEMIYVYDSELDTNFVYPSCSKFGQTIGMDSSNVADRARSCHLARNGRYYIFFANTEKRSKALSKYYDKLLDGLNTDKKKRDEGSDVNANNRITTRLNYAIKFYTIALNVLNRYVFSGAVKESEIDTIQSYIDILSAYYQDDAITLHKNKKEKYLEYCRRNNYPICDNRAHRGKGIIVYDIRNNSIQPFESSVLYAECLRDSGIKIAPRTVINVIQCGKPIVSRYLVYPANTSDRETTMIAVRKLYKEKAWNGFYDYMRGYYAAERICDEIKQLYDEF